jgi:hypothetical protein
MSLAMAASASDRLTPSSSPRISYSAQGQELAAGRAVCLHVALVVDGLEIVLVVLPVHLAAYYHGIVVFAEGLRLRAGVVEASTDGVALVSNKVGQVCSMKRPIYR